MIVAICLIFVFLIFPLIINVSAIYVKNNGKLYIALRFFFFKILSGYFQVINEGVALHLNDKKAFIIRYKSLFDIKKNFELVKDFTINNLLIGVEIGDVNGKLKIMTTSFLMRYIIFFINKFLYYKKNYLKLNFDVGSIKDSNCLNVYIKFSLFLNVLVLLLSIVKFVGGKLIYGIKKNGKQNK